MIGSLFAVLGKKGLAPVGNLTFSYLNNPQRWAKEHWLTEISIPVDRAALKLAGTLGDFTDIKVVPASTLAVVVKPAGMAGATGSWTGSFFVRQAHFAGSPGSTEVTCA